MEIGPSPPQAGSVRLVGPVAERLSLQDGQRFTARVLGAGDNGRLLLNIGGVKVEAHSSVPLKAGQTLQLIAELNRNRGTVTLRVQPPPEPPSAHSRAMRNALPRQVPLDVLVRALDRGRAESNLLPPRLSQAVGRLLDQLPTPGRLADPAGLKRAIADSGLFTEAQLGRAGAIGNGDLKAALVRLAAALRAHNRQSTALPARENRGSETSRSQEGVRTVQEGGPKTATRQPPGGRTGAGNSTGAGGPANRPAAPPPASRQAPPSPAPGTPSPAAAAGTSRPAAAAQTAGPTNQAAGTGGPKSIPGPTGGPQPGQPVSPAGQAAGTGGPKSIPGPTGGPQPGQPVNPAGQAAGGGPKSPVAAGPPPVQQAVAAPTATVQQHALTQLLTGLLRQTEGALARIQINQLASLPRGDQGEPQQWIVELPVRQGEEEHLLKMRIRRDDSSREAHEEQGQRWSVRLDLSTAEHGALHIVVTVVAGKVTTTFWAERQSTAELFRSQLDVLRERLSEAGLEVENVASYKGRPAEEAAPAGTPSLLDLTV